MAWGLESDIAKGIYVYTCGLLYSSTNNFVPSSMYLYHNAI